MVLGGLVPQNPITWTLVIVVATAFVWLASGWLESSAEYLAGHYGLPPVIQGSVVVAIGSSFPELASVVVAGLSGVFGLGVGAIVGSAIFNILVIPGVAGLTTEDPIDANRALVYKEAQFYMIAVSALIVTFALAVIYYPSPEGPLVGTVTRPLAVIPLLLYGLYVWIQWQDTSDHEAADGPEGGSVRRQWATLALSLVVILVAVEQLVGAVEGLAGTFNVGHFLAGVTVLAAATSLPDALVSVRAARDGRGVTSLGNVLGSNTFDLLVAIPVGVLLASAAPVNFAVAIPMMGVLTVATILLFTTLRTGMKLTRPESWLLLVAYAIFVAWVIAESAGITTVIRGT